MEFRKALLIGLKRKDLTQRNLSELMNLSPTAVHQWVNGKSSPNAERTIDIIKKLGIQDLIFKETDREYTDKDIENVKKGIKYSDFKATEKKINRIEQDTESMRGEIAILKDTVNSLQEKLNILLNKE